MTTFDTAFEKLLGHEGGYTEGKGDPGGETRFGVSKRSYPDEDLKNLTLERSKEIYKRDFWDRAQCDKLPAALAFQVFDAAVNSGIGQSIRFLQRAVGVADDGQLGPLTIAAIQRREAPEMIALFNAERLEFMTKLSVWDQFSRGWCRRIAANLKEAA